MIIHAVSLVDVPETALNYDANACYDDGNCSYPTFGCLDSTASNYNVLATVDDGTCCYSPLFTLLMNDTYGDGWNNNEFTLTSEDNMESYGPFTFNNGYSDEVSFCLPNGCYSVNCDNGNWQEEVSWTLKDANDSTILSGGSPFSQQLCVYSVIYGCTNSIADNYNADANTDDGSCIISGCTNANADNYNADANTDDGSCIISGCTNANADNYNADANTDDGSCIISGCTNAIADNYNVEANNDDGSCIISGCTDINALNYDIIANEDDGSCEYYCENNITLTIVTDCWGEETSWSIVDENNVELENTNTHSYEDITTYNIDLCLNNGCYTFNIEDSYGDGVNGSQWFYCNVDGNYFITNQDDSTLLVEMDDSDFGFGTSHQFCLGTIISGCTNDLADNYNPEAIQDDGSGIISGCTNAIADNYNAEANNDDGSCIISGCTNTIADNYNADANTDDGSCIISGCTNTIADNYNADANNDDGSCIISGCTNTIADNYNADANTDDGLDARYCSTMH